MALLGYLIWLIGSAALGLIIVARTVEDSVLLYFVSLFIHTAFSNFVLNLGSAESLMAMLTMTCFNAYGRTSYYDGAEFTGVRYYPAVVENRAFRWLRRRWFKHEVIAVNIGDTITTAAESSPNITANSVMNRSRPRLYCCYPHGHLAFHVIGSFMVDQATTQHWPRPVRVGVVNAWFNIPFLRDAALWFGAVNVRWHTLKQLMTTGTDVAIIPDGVHGIGIPTGATGHKPYHFLKRCHTSPTPIEVVIVYTPGELGICRTWKTEWRWITRLRELSTFWVGKPLFSFFLGPWPWVPMQTFHTLNTPLVVRYNESYDAYKARFDAQMSAVKTYAALYEQNAIAARM